MKKWKVIVGILVAFAIGSVAAGYFMLENAKKAVDPTDEGIINYQLLPGSTSSSVLADLEELGLIENATLSSVVIKLNKWSHIQAGEYELSRSQTLEEMFVKFGSGDVVEPDMIKVTVPEGAIIVDVSKKFAELTDLTEEAFLEAINEPAFLSSLIEKYWFLSDEILNDQLKYPLEGYVYPATYSFLENKTYTVEELMTTILDVTAQRIEPLKAKFEASSLTVHENFALASLVEAETPHTDEMTMVAGVFANRLAINMKLQSDTTIQYVLDDRVVHVTGSMLTLESPYNTYYVTGIPIGAVGSPSFDALSAVLEPAEHDYIFFIGDLYQCIDGKTHFFKTYDEHLDFYHKNLRPSYDAGENVCK